jgi:uncharacterized membrane protein (Fun14 family)
MPDPQSTTAREPSLRQSLGLDRHPLTRPKFFVLGIAILMMILGVVIALTADHPPPPATVTPSSSPATPDSSGTDGSFFRHGFAPSRPSSPGGASDREPVVTTESGNGSIGIHDLSPFMVKGGFGLFIGFAIGFAIRAFLRLAIVMAGFFFLVLSMMAYVGWIEIHWSLMEGQFTQVLSALGAQFSSFQTFLTGAIPASGLTLAGFAIGLRRK